MSHTKGFGKKKKGCGELLNNFNASLPNFLL